MKLFFSAVLCSVVMAISLEPYPEFESLKMFGDETSNLAPSAVEDELFIQNNSISKFSKRENIEMVPRASDIQLSEHHPPEFSSDVKSDLLTRTARQWFSGFIQGNEDDDEDKETDIRKEEENKESHSPKPQVPIYMQGLTYSQLYEDDLRVKNAFLASKMALYSKLREFSDGDEINFVKFAKNKVALEQDYLKLVADFANLTSSGNLFRDECERDLSLVKVFYESFLYGNALLLRKFHMEEEDSSTNDVRDALVAKLGLLQMNLIFLQIHLHKFADAYGHYRNPAFDYNKNLHWVEKYLNYHLKECDLLPAEELKLGKALKEQAKHLIEALQTIKRSAEIESKPSEPDIPEPEIPLTPPLVEEMFNEETKSLISEVDKNIQLLGQMLNDEYKGTKIDFNYYSSARDSVENSLFELGGMTLLPDVETRIRDYRENINMKLKCMDRALSCARTKLCSTVSYSDEECVHLSFAVFEKDAEKLYKKIGQLFSSIFDKTIENNGAEKAPYEVYSFHLLTLKTVDTSRWSDEPRLNQVLDRIQQLERPLEVMAHFLRHKESFKDAIEDETVVCDEEFTKNIDKQLHQIETILSENLNPSKNKGSTLKNEHALQKNEFDKIVQKMNSAGDICVAASSGLVEKVSSQFNLIETLFSNTPSYDRYSDKVLSR